MAFTAAHQNKANPGPYTSAHLNQNGPGDARPTGFQIVEDNGLVGKLTDKKGEVALKDILEPDRVELIQIDVGFLDSVRTAAKTFLSKSSTLNVLINNAAIMACPEAKSVDGFESQLAINFLGHFLLFKLLEPTLLKSSTHLKKAWSSGEAVQRFWKSTAQGAATTMVAAIGKEWEGKGGVYLEDCQEAIPTPPGCEGSIGAAAHAFDPEKETKLWDMATKMVGL
ncbi:MAG: hypothetical protein Q9201_006252 [Fulgogasparrea decipioides]